MLSWASPFLRGGVCEVPIPAAFWLIGTVLQVHGDLDTGVLYNGGFSGGLACPSAEKNTNLWGCRSPGREDGFKLQRETSFIQRTNLV